MSQPERTVGLYSLTSLTATVREAERGTSSPGVHFPQWNSTGAGQMTRSPASLWTVGVGRGVGEGRERSAGSERYYIKEEEGSQPTPPVRRCWRSP